MPPTDTSEKGLEALIVQSLTGLRAEPSPIADSVWCVRQELAPYGGAGYVEGDAKDYDRDHAVDLAQLLGSRSRASEIMRRKRPLTMEQAWKLHREWNIPAEVLLRPYHTARA